MNTLQTLFSNPIFAAIAGWLAFNVIMLSMYKDDNESTFAIMPYAKEHWDNWAASFFMIPILLFVGFNKLDIGMIDADHLKWSDLYYPCSGFATEAVKMAYKKWKAKNQ